MTTPLQCVLSYGLACAPADVIEPPPPTPLVAADPDTPTPAADPAAAPKGAASLVLAKVQTYYDDTKDFSTAFTQTYTAAVYGTKKVSTGKLRVKRPGRMVWDYDEATASDVWVTEKTVWVVEDNTRQVIKRDIGGSDFAGAEKFLFGGHAIIDDFRVKFAEEAVAKRYGKAGHTTLTLQPKKANTHYKTLTFVVDDATGQVTTFIVRNQDESINRFEFSAFKRNPGLADSEFTFSKPKGYVEIEE
jgi:outer membrane lipoprotein carrier protein